MTKEIMKTTGMAVKAVVQGTPLVGQIIPGQRMFTMTLSATKIYLIMTVTCVCLFILIGLVLFSILYNNRAKLPALPKLEETAVKAVVTGELAVVTGELGEAIKGCATKLELGAALGECAKTTELGGLTTRLEELAVSEKRERNALATQFSSNLTTNYMVRLDLEKTYAAKTALTEETAARGKAINDEKAARGKAIEAARKEWGAAIEAAKKEWVAAIAEEKVDRGREIAALEIDTLKGKVTALEGQLQSLLDNAQIKAILNPVQQA